MPAYDKQVIEHPSLYIVSFTKSSNLPCIIFAHGGPGLNCGVLEYLVENEGIFDTLQFDLILYDQRGCGRSKPVEETVVHADNVCDLEEVCRTASEKAHYEIAAIAGHSYGAKLLFDYFQYSGSTVPGIFISTAPSILTPRVKNLLLDLAYLKTIDRDQYQTILEEFEGFSLEKIWELTERLAKVFQQNKARPFFYWANLDWKDKVEAIQDSVSLPINSQVFTSVRHDLYSKPEAYSVDLDSISTLPHLWINGFHDMVMDGPSALEKKYSTTTLFFQSAHYPHIEEHEKFCGEVNAFLKKL